MLEHVDAQLTTKLSTLSDNDHYSHLSSIGVFVVRQGCFGGVRETLPPDPGCTTVRDDCNSLHVSSQVDFLFDCLS